MKLIELPDGTGAINPMCIHSVAERENWNGRKRVVVYFSMGNSITLEGMSLKDFQLLFQKSTS